MTRFVSPSSVLVLALALAGPLGCRTPSSKLPIDELTKQERDQGKGEQAQAIEPLPVERPADLLPQYVPVMAEAVRPAELLRLFQPLGKIPEFERARSEAATMLGADLLDPQQWAQVGVSIDGPVGVGLLDVRSQAFFVYVTMSDQGRFEDTVERVLAAMGSSDRLAISDVGNARMLRLSDEFSLILREGVAMMVFVDRPDEAPHDFAATVATIDPRESLGRSDGYAWTRSKLREVDDGMVFLAPRSLIDAIQAESDSDSDYGVRYAQEQLDDARRRGANSQELHELEQRLVEEQRWAEERARARAGEQAMVRELFGPIDAIVLAADLRDDGIDGQGQLRMPGTALLRRLFVATDQVSPLLQALDEAPLFVVDGRVDVPTLVSVVELLARADGESLDEINGEIRKETGVDALRDLVPTLRGDGGMALTLARPLDKIKLGKFGDNVGVAGHLGLAKPDGMRALLDGLAQQKQLSGALSKAKRGDGWVLAVPEWRELQLAIVGDRLLLSSDAGFIARVRDAKPGAQAQALAAADHPMRGPVPTPAMRMYQRWSWLALVNANEPWEQKPEDMIYFMNEHSQLSPDEAAKVPRSKAFKKKFKELEKAVGALNAFNRGRSQRDFERTLKMSEQFGDFGLQVEALGDGLGVRGQWRYAPGTTPFEVGIAAFMFGGMDDDWTEYERLSQETYRLQEELRQLRQADLDAAAAKQGSSSK